MEQKTEKKTYEEPKVTKVVFDFKEVITWSVCVVVDGMFEYEEAPVCYD